MFQLVKVPVCQQTSLYSVKLTATFWGVVSLNIEPRSEALSYHFGHTDMIQYNPAKERETDMGAQCGILYFLVVIVIL